MMNPYQRAVDTELVSAHLGIADSSDSYDKAKKKLDELIKWHIDVATDPAVNGGFVLAPIQQSIQASIEFIRDAISRVQCDAQYVSDCSACQAEDALRHIETFLKEHNANDPALFQG